MDCGLIELEQALRRSDLDDVPFGVIAVDRQGPILNDDAYESRLAARSRERVLGRNFYRGVAHQRFDPPFSLRAARNASALPSCA